MDVNDRASEVVDVVTCVTTEPVLEYWSTSRAGAIYQECKTSHDRLHDPSKGALTSTQNDVKVIRHDYVGQEERI